MSKMMKMAAVGLVLAMVAFGPTAAIAAPHQNPYASSASGAKFGLIDVLMQILGIGNPVAQPTDHQSGIAKPASGSSTTVTGSSTTGRISTDTATWGGGGRCVGPNC